VVIPAFTGFYLLGLSHVMPYAFSPMVLLGIAGVLMVVGALMGPETRDVDMQAPVVEVATVEDGVLGRPAAPWG
jgi:hypothetical protein